MRNSLLFHIWVSFAFLTIQSFQVGCHQSMRFDSDIWKKQELSDPKNPVRLQMVSDLLKRYHLEGMSKKQIDELLGI